MNDTVSRNEAPKNMKKFFSSPGFLAFLVIFLGGIVYEITTKKGFNFVKSANVQVAPVAEFEQKQAPDQIGEFVGRFNLGARKHPDNEYFVVKFGNELRHYKVDPFGGIDPELKAGMLVIIQGKHIDRLVPVDNSKSTPPPVPMPEPLMPPEHSEPNRPK